MGEKTKHIGIRCGCVGPPGKKANFRKPKPISMEYVVFKTAASGRGKKHYLMGANKYFSKLAKQEVTGYSTSTNKKEAKRFSNLEDALKLYDAYCKTHHVFGLYGGADIVGIENIIKYEWPDYEDNTE